MFVLKFLAALFTIAKRWQCPSAQARARGWLSGPHAWAGCCSARRRKRVLMLWRRTLVIKGFPLTLFY